VGPISDGIIGIFHLLNPSGSITALGSLRHTSKTVTGTCNKALFRNNGLNVIASVRNARSYSSVHCGGGDFTVENAVALQNLLNT